MMSLNKLTLVVRDGDEVIGRVIMTSSDLALNDAGGNCHDNSSIKSLSGKDHYPSYQETKDEIRSSLRSFYFDKVDYETQHTKSIVISPSISPSARMQIFIRGLTDNIIIIECKPMDTIKNVKKLIRDKTGIPLKQQCLVISGRQLEDRRTVFFYNIPNESTVNIGFRLPGGGASCILPIDLTKPKVHNGKGVAGGEKWETYTKGFNLLGHCHNTNCISKGEEVCVKLGFPEHLILTDSKKVHKCPGCNDAYITVNSFLVAAARAKIRFRKSFNDENETLILEAPSDDYWQYATLLENTLKDKETISYDYIEITTVAYGMSFNNCQMCNDNIKLSKEEILPCGRAFHKKCLSSNGGCPICHLSKFPLSELPKIVQQNQRITLDVPNHVYGQCSEVKNSKCVSPHHSSRRQEDPKPIGKFLRDVISTQFETLSNTKIPITELQQSFVANNLPNLIKNTQVNAGVLEKLRELKVITAVEEVNLSRLDEIEKARELYKVVPTRESGIAALITTLSESGQHRAVLNLSMFDSMLATYSKKQALDQEI